jgi:hypothetical protein
VLGQVEVERGDLLGDQAGHLDRAVHLEVGVVGGAGGPVRIDPGRDVQEHRLGLFGADPVEERSRGGRQVDHRDAGLLVEFVDLLDVLGEGDVELAGRGVEAAARNGGDEDGGGALLERARDVVVPQVHLVVVRRSVALGDRRRRVIVSELDKEVVALLDLVEDGVEAALLDEGARGPSADGVVGDRDVRVVEVAVDDLAPAGLGLPVGVVGLDGGVGGEVDGDPVGLRLGGRGGGHAERRRRGGRCGEPGQRASAPERSRGSHVHFLVMREERFAMNRFKILSKRLRRGETLPGAV